MDSGASSFSGGLPVVVASADGPTISSSRTAPASDIVSVTHDPATSRRLRLAVVVTRLDVGGVPEHIVILVGHLAATYDVTVVCREVITQHRSRLERAGVRIKMIDFARLPDPLRDLRALLQLAAFLRREHFDIVHSHMSKGALIGGIAARIAGAPIVLNTAHNFGVLALQNAILRGLFRWYDKTLFALTLDQLVTVSECQKDQIVAEGLVSADKVTTIWNGIDTHSFRERALRGPTREELRLARDTVVVVTVARLVWFKAIDVLIEAADLVKSTSNVQFLVVGDGVLKSRLEQLIERKGLVDRVRLLGERHDVPGLLALADIFALPSVSEGMPIAIMEAMAVGLPVVATAVDGTPELVVDGQTGILVPSGDPSAFANALRPLIADAELRRALGQAGRQRVDSGFSDSSMAAATDRLYRQLSERAGRCHKREVPLQS
jgi:glycosyltransferase involved in cell wall biosynthesis